MGDDAADIIILNNTMKEEERISLFAKGESLRTPKAIKADIEASFIVNHNNAECLLYFGSGSLTPHRDSAFLFNPVKKEVLRIDYSSFYNELRKNFKDLNIEAAAIIDDDFLFGIRANTANPNNFIAIASSTVLSPEFKRKIQIKLPLNLQIGISGMDYDSKTDQLFITFSSEDTSNALDDGKVGDSYLAIVEDAKSSLSKDELIIKNLENLTDIDALFTQQKIEGICVIDSKQLLLVADDDLGSTQLFNLNY